MKFAFKKEFMFFSRTMRMFGVIFSIMIFALADPLIMKAAQWMMSFTSDVISSQDAAAVDESTMSMLSMFDDLSASDITASSVPDFCTTASLIVLLVLMQPAGGEQKKRSVIIPQCAGLKPTQYVIPKFIMYPLTAFVTALVSLPICGLICMIMFGGSVSAANTLATGAIVGVYIAFMIVAELAIGICTGKPGLSAVITILAANLLPTVFSLFRIDRFNPFILPVIAADAARGTYDTLNIFVSVGVSVTLGLILFFLTLFTLTVKKIENEGSDPLL